jgi:hypothetical protein
MGFGSNIVQSWEERRNAAFSYPTALLALARPLAATKVTLEEPLAKMFN